MVESKSRKRCRTSATQNGIRIMESPCAKCSMRAKYDANPKSLIGRLWHWHINFCPGWRGYFSSLSPQQQEELQKQYNLKQHSK